MSLDLECFFWQGRFILILISGNLTQISVWPKLVITDLNIYKTNRVKVLKDFWTLATKTFNLVENIAISATD